ncbi:unnamed protein product [Sphagnum jensenii]|uniref:Uncharacterized protein n=1 Tax=Sphagnum jensenii TaxID=128206 RepID=A0ABP0X336_9BRYO
MMNLQGQQAKEQQQGGPQTTVAQRQHQPQQSLNNLQDEARDASREALEAQQEAQEAMKRAYQKQVAAQEKAQQASQQVLAQQDMAKQVANAAATQAAERAAIEQREIVEKQLGQASIAQQAANAALNAHAISQTSSQQSVSTSPVVQPGQPVQAFNQNVQASGVQPLGTGATQGQQVISAQVCQQMLLQAADQMREAAIAQMTTAQSLASSGLDPNSQQVCK